MNFLLWLVDWEINLLINNTKDFDLKKDILYEMEIVVIDAILGGSVDNEYERMIRLGKKNPQNQEYKNWLSKKLRNTNYSKKFIFIKPKKNETKDIHIKIISIKEIK